MNPNAKGNYSYTTAEARSCLYSTFWTPWNDPLIGWRMVLGNLADTDPGKPEVFWDKEEPETPPPITAPNVYVYVRHTTGGQASLRGDQGRRWRRTGFMLHRMHLPDALPLKTGDALAKVIYDAFEGKRGVGAGAGITFPKVRPIEQGGSKDRYKIDINVSFEYDELLNT